MLMKKLRPKTRQLKQLKYKIQQSQKVRLFKQLTDQRSSSRRLSLKKIHLELMISSDPSLKELQSTLSRRKRARRIRMPSMIEFLLIESSLLMLPLSRLSKQEKKSDTKNSSQKLSVWLDSLLKLVSFLNVLSFWSVMSTCVRTKTMRLTTFTTTLLDWS